jgi:hypothetical protein
VLVSSLFVRSTAESFTVTNPIFVFEPSEYPDVNLSHTTAVGARSKWTYVRDSNWRHDCNVIQSTALTRVTVQQHHHDRIYFVWSLSSFILALTLIAR